MTKHRKTKKEKLLTSQRKLTTTGFVIDDRWLQNKQKKIKVESPPSQKVSFKADLTKTLILTMLVLALELAIWNYLSRH